MFGWPLEQISNRVFSLMQQASESTVSFVIHME